MHTSIPPAQVFLPQQAAPGHSSSPPSPQGGPSAAHPTWKLTADIKAAAEPSLHPGGKFPHRCPQAATSQGDAEGWSQHLPRQCHGQSLHQQLSLRNSPVHCTGRGIYSPNPLLLGFMPFLLLHPCLLSYTLSSIYTQYFNLVLGLSQSLAKPGRAPPLTSGSIGVGSWPSRKQAVLTGSLLISHLKSHLPALHPFWLLFIDFPANGLNLSCFAAQLCCSGPGHIRAVPPATAMLLPSPCILGAPPHHDGCISLPCAD